MGLDFFWRTTLLSSVVDFCRYKYLFARVDFMNPDVSFFSCVLIISSAYHRLARFGIEGKDGERNYEARDENRARVREGANSEWKGKGFCANLQRVQNLGADCSLVAEFGPDQFYCRWLYGFSDTMCSFFRGSLLRRLLVSSNLARKCGDRMLRKSSDSILVFQHFYQVASFFSSSSPSIIQGRGENFHSSSSGLVHQCRGELDCGPL